jgi:hypothetical protein
MILTTQNIYFKKFLKLIDTNIPIYIEIAGRKIGPDFPPLVIAEMELITRFFCRQENG